MVVPSLEVVSAGARKPRPPDDQQAAGNRPTSSHSEPASLRPGHQQNIVGRSRHTSGSSLTRLGACLHSSHQHQDRGTHGERPNSPPKRHRARDLPPSSNAPSASTCHPVSALSTVNSICRTQHARARTSPSSKLFEILQSDNTATSSSARTSAKSSCHSTLRKFAYYSAHAASTRSGI